MSDNARLNEAFASEHLSWLVAALRRRFENGTYRADGTVRLTRPSLQQRQACDRLLGRKPSSGGALTVRLSISMSEQGVAIHEERVLATLLKDLQPNSDEG